MEIIGVSDEEGNRSSQTLKCYVIYYFAKQMRGEKSSYEKLSNKKSLDKVCERWTLNILETLKCKERKDQLFCSLILLLRFLLSFLSSCPFAFSPVCCFFFFHRNVSYFLNVFVSMLSQICSNNHQEIEFKFVAVPHLKPFTKWSIEDCVNYTY